MAKYIYVQAQYFVEDDEDLGPVGGISFRHTEVEADNDSDAYLFGQRIYPYVDPECEFMNDYVICLERAGDPLKARAGMKL